MKLTSSLKRIPRGKKLIIGAAIGLVVVSTSSVLAFNSLNTTTAEDTPIEVKVDDHEKRISKNEQDIADTKGRVDSVEQKTDENTKAVEDVQKQVVVVQGKTNTVTTQAAQAQPAPAASTPAPAKTVNPRLIVGTQQQENRDREGNVSTWTCTYSLESGRSVSVIQGQPCSGAGSEISSDVAQINGIQ